MSPGLIVAIVVIALVLIVLFAVILPRARRGAKMKQRERELEQRRTHRAEEHRTEAAERRSEAEMAEQRARMAETEAQRERAEADLREQRAAMHERGMADHELIDDSERDKFAGTSAVRDEPAEMRDDERPMHEPTGDYEQGRTDEAREREAGRFEREPERADHPTRSGPA